jgi:hypothetical protein
VAWIEIQFGLDRSHTERYRGGEIPLILDPQARDTPVIQHTALIPAIRHLGTRAARHTPPILVPVTDTPCTATPAITPQRAGRLGPTTLSGRLANFRPARAHPCDHRLWFGHSDLFTV